MLGDPKEIVVRNRMTTWFPAIQKALDDTAYPKTEFVDLPDDINLIEFMESANNPDDKMAKRIELFGSKLVDAAGRVGGFPCFLRNNMTSGKHELTTPCIVRSASDMLSSVFSIAEFCELAYWSQEGTETWAVREFLRGYPVFYAFGYEKFGTSLPIGEEWRFVVRDYKVVDWFPYWPIAAFDDHTCRSFDGDKLSDDQIREAVAGISVEDEDVIQSLSYRSERVCSYLEGDWSIDWMKTTDGYKCIDMADADSSWIASEEDRKFWKDAISELKG